MDYEKLYKEALEKAKDWHCDAAGNCDVKTCLEELFPQLKVNEEEKIRKGIVALVKQSSEILDKHNQENMLAWLEKHKEVLCVDNEEIKFDENVDFFHEAVKEAYQDGFEKGKKDALKEQEWTKEDDTNLKNLIWSIHMKSIRPLDEMDDRGRYKNYEDWLKSLKTKDGPQFSGKDKDMINLLIEIFKVNYPNAVYKANPINTTDMSAKSSEEIIEWLESLKS